MTRFAIHLSDALHARNTTLVFDNSSSRGAFE